MYCNYEMGLEEVDYVADVKVNYSIFNENILGPVLYFVYIASLSVFA